jgi:hypothetical protein
LCSSVLTSKAVSGDAPPRIQKKGAITIGHQFSSPKNQPTRVVLRIYCSKKKSHRCRVNPFSSPCSVTSSRAPGSGPAPATQATGLQRHQASASVSQGSSSGGRCGGAWTRATGRSSTSASLCLLNLCVHRRPVEPPPSSSSPSSSLCILVFSNELPAVLYFSLLPPRSTHQHESHLHGCGGERIWDVAR